MIEDVSICLSSAVNLGRGANFRGKSCQRESGEGVSLRGLF